MQEGVRKILALTGIRSEYDLLYPLLDALDNHPGFDLGIIVSGAHLTPLHDYSVHQIEQDGFRIIEKIENLLYSNSLLGKAKSSAILMEGLAQTLSREQPDYLIVLGDREEAIIGSLTASYMNIPVIHVAGGDNTFPEHGDVDEQVRHASTKLSHVHLTMMEEHAERIRMLGEESWRVHNVGNAGVDRLRLVPQWTEEELAKCVGDAVLSDYIVLIYHPLSSNIDQAAYEMRVCLEQCLKTGMEVFVGAPNSDPGSQDVIAVLNEYALHSKVHQYRNMERNAFVNLLRRAKCLVGNSSLAIHEGAYICLPSINVGERQRGRIAGRNVQFVPGTMEDVEQALKRALYDNSYKQDIVKDKNLYGDGYMVEKAIKIINTLPSNDILLAKKITY